MDRHVAPLRLKQPTVDRHVAPLRLKQPTVDRHVAPLRHIPVFVLTPQCCMFRGEATNTSFIVFDLT